jgi:hypothetical protein
MAQTSQPSNTQSQKGRRFGIRTVAVIAFSAGAVLGWVMGMLSRSPYTAVAGFVTGICLVAFSARLSESADREGEKLILTQRDFKDGCSAESIQGKQDLSWIENHEATNTIIGQAVAGAISLTVGGVLIVSLAKWANTWGAYWPGYGQHAFFAGIIYGGIGLIVLTVLLPYVQFQDALSPLESFKRSLKYAFWGGAFALLIDLPLMSTVYASLRLVAIEVTYIVVIYLLCGLVVGVAQLVRLWVDSFDKKHHVWLLSSDCDIKACQAGMLPYRARVGGFWRAVAIALPCGILLLVGGVMGMKDRETQSQFIVGLTFQGGFIVGLALAPLGVTKITQYRGLIREPRIKVVEGPVAKTSQRAGRSVTLYLTFDDRRFRVNKRMWNGIADGQPCRVWYSAVNDQLLAYELL